MRRVVALGAGNVFARLSTMKKGFSVHHVNVLSDNYAYVVVDEATKQAALVDAADPDACLKRVAELGVKVVAVLTTHHHEDHSGGNQDLFSRLVPAVPFYGADDRVPSMTYKLADGEKFRIGEVPVVALHTPCHTAGSVAYVVGEEKEQKAVFTGDTLFIGGCGRFFEGTADQMDKALNKVLSSLPDSTLVYCGHEYTQSNLRFAAHVEPENKDIKAKAEWAAQTREKGLPTVPSTIGEEKTFNPFMRNRVPEVAKFLGLAVDADPVEVMKGLREAKNNFK